jgi:hypothetical protein
MEVTQDIVLCDASVAGDPILAVLRNSLPVDVRKFATVYP